MSAPNLPPICENCASWAHRRHMVAAGGVLRHYGTCMNPENDVRMSVGFDSSEPIHDIKWSWDTCSHFEVSSAALEEQKT